MSAGVVSGLGRAVPAPTGGRIFGVIQARARALVPHSHTRTGKAATAWAPLWRQRPAPACARAHQRRRGARAHAARRLTRAWTRPTAAARWWTRPATWLASTPRPSCARPRRAAPRRAAPCVAANARSLPSFCTRGAALRRHVRGALRRAARAHAGAPRSPRAHKHPVLRSAPPQGRGSGVGFALPSDMLLEAVPNLIVYGSAAARGVRGATQAPPAGPAAAAGARRPERPAPAATG